MSAVPRYFIPVCLYPHTKYRTTAGVTALFEKYRLRSHDHLIVIADRLLVLDRLVTGRYWSVNSATIKARNEAELVARLINNTAHKCGAHARGKIVFWDDIANTTAYGQFASRLRDQVLANRILSEAIDGFVDRRVSRFGLGSAPEQERRYEQEYLVSEICMSVYCTEMLEFRTEVWERPPAPDVPDPLKLLYRECPSVVESVTGRPAARTLELLYEEALAIPKDMQAI